MAISRPSTLKYQTNQNLSKTHSITYTLPPSNKNKANAQPLAETQSEISFIKRDLIKTILIAVGVLALEMLIWWRLH